MDDPWPIDDAIALVAVGAIILVGGLVHPAVPPSLSITGRAVLLTALLFGLFVLAAAPGTDTTVGWLAVGVAPFAGMAVTVTLGLLHEALAAAFAAMIAALIVVYYAQDGFLRLSRREAAVAVMVLLALTSVVLAVDLSAGGVTHDIAVRDQVPVRSGEPIVAGTATARNAFAFREPAQYPDLQACLYSGDGRSELVYGYDTTGGPFVEATVPPRETVTTGLTLVFTAEQAHGLPRYLPVERAATCPDDRTDPGIVIAREDGSAAD